MEYSERFSDEPQFGPRARPHPEERAGWSGPAKSNGRTRVSKDEDGRLGSPSCFETHRSALGLWKRLRSSCCDAPQHEGDGARRIFWPNEPKRGVCVFGRSEAPTCGCTKRSLAQFHCFRIVIYNDFCNSDVSAALSAQDFARRRAGTAGAEPPSHSNGRDPRRPDSWRFFVRPRVQFDSHPRILATSLRHGCDVIAIILRALRAVGLHCGQAFGFDCRGRRKAL
jgi:hypothetical protein